MRILVDITTPSPVIIIPQSHTSENLLVIDLGNITITNMFKFSGEPGTISRNSTKFYNGTNTQQQVVDNTGLYQEQLDRIRLLFKGKHQR